MGVAFLPNIACLQLSSDLKPIFHVEQRCGGDIARLVYLQSFIWFQGANTWHFKYKFQAHDSLIKGASRQIRYFFSIWQLNTPLAPSTASRKFVLVRHASNKATRTFDCVKILTKWSITAGYFWCYLLNCAKQTGWIASHANKRPILAPLSKCIDKCLANNAVTSDWRYFVDTIILHCQLVWKSNINDFESVWFKQQSCGAANNRTTINRYLFLSNWSSATCIFSQL